MRNLKGLSELTLRKLHEQKNKITEPITIPHTSDTVKAKEELEKNFTGEGKVHFSFAEDTLIAFRYAETHFHYITGNSLINDIEAGISIVFNNYK